TGLPKTVILSSEEVRHALEDPVNQIIDAIKSTLDKTPPELAADIMDRGIVLAGGGALLQGLDQRLRQETHMPTHLAESPLTCVAVGSGRSLEEFEAMRNRARASHPDRTRRGSRLARSALRDLRLFLDSLERPTAPGRRGLPRRSVARAAHRELPFELARRLPERRRLGAAALRGRGDAGRASVPGCLELDARALPREEREPEAAPAGRAAEPAARGLRGREEREPLPRPSAQVQAFAD